MKHDPAELERFEDRTIVPLLAEINVEPTRTFEATTLVPGDILFLMDNADSFVVRGQSAYWQALTVLYCDRSDRKGEVFGMSARYDRDGGQLVRCEIAGVVRLERDQDDVVSWYNPLDGRRLIRYPNGRAHDLLLNAWYLFRGVVLPMLYTQSYRFVEQREAARYQAQVIHQITQAYRGLV